MVDGNRGIYWKCVLLEIKKSKFKRRHLNVSFEFLLLNFDFLRSYKPVSRILFPSVNSGRYHLSVPIITHRDQSAYPPTRLSASNEQFSRVGLCGISACKVCPQIMLLLNAVSSYLTFSPLQPTPASPPGRGHRGGL